MVASLTTGCCSKVWKLVFPYGSISLYTQLKIDDDVEYNQGRKLQYPDSRRVSMSTSDSPEYSATDPVRELSG